MAPEQDLTPEQIAVIGKIEKLLRLAAKNPNEHEREQAASKAAALMAEWNLDQAKVEENSGESGKRTDEKLRGGHMEFERDLWKAVAELNFCIYFSLIAYENAKGPWTPKVPGRPESGFKRETITKKVRQHRLVGRTVNVRATKVMSEYLMAAVERVTREQIDERKVHPYGTWARSFREGAADNIVERLSERRRHLMAEERRRAEEAAQAASAASRAGATTERAVTIHSFAKSELEANKDFMDPERHAKAAAAEAASAERRAYWARVEAEEDAARARWAAENPEEAKRQAAEEAAEEERERKREERNARRRAAYIPSYGGGRQSSYKEKGDRNAKQAGYDAGGRISIDQQTDHRKSAGALS